MCQDLTKTTTVDGIEYVTVFKPENQLRKNLMRKDALRKVSNA